MNPRTIVLPLLFAAIIPKKKFGRIPSPSYRGIIEVKHYIPGRIRYSIPAIVDNPNKLKNIIKVVSDFDNIIDIKGSSVTGSLTVQFEHINASLVTGILIHLLELKDEIEKPVVGNIYKKILSIGTAFNRGVYEETKGMFDLNSLISISLGVFGVTALIRKPVMLPGAWTLLWWFYNTSMRIDKKVKN